MFLEKNRNRINTEYDNLCVKLPDLMGDVTEKIKTLDDETGLAMKYLYITMPLSDIGNYSTEVFLDYASHGVFLYHNNPYVQNMPEDIYLNYVLYHRVNNEEITPCRALFYDDMKERIQGMSMKEAAIEINYWCAEKATYQSTDSRTAAPLTVYLCGHGRCGEESTFAISALRSAGIPARQVYAPYWCHCDDNHAWVELWCDGAWYFTGACEPEPILNKGWFNHASSRAMMVHSRWFDHSCPENEEIIGKEGNATVLNQLSRYALTRRIFLEIKDQEGKPVPDADISTEVLNYSCFMSITRIKADHEGCASLLTGFGSLLITAQKDGKIGELLIDTRESDHAVVTVKTPSPKEQWESFDIYPPTDAPVNHDLPTEEQKAVRDIRLARALEIRTDKVNHFVPEWKKVSESQKDESKIWMEKLMEVLSKKDRIDGNPQVILSHVKSALPLKDRYPEDIFIKYVMNPRIYYEVLTSYREEIQGFFTEEEKTLFRKNPREIWNWIRENIRENGDEEGASIYTTPKAALKLKTASSMSRRILFAAIARTLGIPARLNPVDYSPEYLMPEEGCEGKEAYDKEKFISVEEEAAKTSALTLENPGIVNWTYFQNWSLARLEQHGFQPLFLFGSTWTDKKLHIPLEPGIYRLITSNRLPNGNIFAEKYEFTLKKDETKVITMEFRDANLSDMLENISILPFYLKNQDKERISGADLTRGNRKILFWLEESREPTEHILNELMEHKEEFRKYQKELLFIIRKKEALEDLTLSKCREALPEIPVYYDSFKENVNTLGRRMYVDPDKLPLIIVTDGELNGIYATSGYNVGTADMLLRILEM